MLTVFTLSAVQAGEEFFISPIPASRAAVEAISVDEKDINVYQVLLAEFKHNDTAGFIQTTKPSSPFDVQLITSTKSASVLVDALIKGEMLSILSQPQIATLIDQKALIVVSDKEGTLLNEIELLPQRRGDDIRTVITLTHKEMRDGKIHSSAQIGNINFHTRLGDDTTMVLIGKLGDKDILFTIRRVQHTENGEQK